VLRFGLKFGCLWILPTVTEVVGVFVRFSCILQTGHIRSEIVVVVVVSPCRPGRLRGHARRCCSTYILARCRVLAGDAGV
jgi:hypothetical protein